MGIKLSKVPFVLMMIFFALACVMLSYYTKRENFIQIISLYSFLFVIFIILYQTASYPKRIFILLGCGLLCRCMLLFSLPNLSDDYFRFIWDGRLMHAGLNPFDQLPVEISRADYNQYGLSEALFKGLNSPHYYTVYPPVVQSVFYVSTWFSKSIIANVVIMKLFILFFEAGSIYLMIGLLKHFKLPQKNVLLYALNPLVIIELCGNVHFEALMLFFLFLSVLLFITQNLISSAFVFSLAICTKLLPLMFLPYIFIHSGFRKGFIFCLMVCIFIALMFLPFISRDFINHLFSSIGLYFQTFEFNAGIYYLIRWIGYQLTGYNIIAISGLILSLISFATILWIAVANYEGRNHFRVFLFILTTYLIFATTVHPWYLTPLIGLSVFTNYRYVIVWSVLIPLSYATYQTRLYNENLLFVSIEYTCVMVFIVAEYWQMKKMKPQIEKPDYKLGKVL